MQCMLACIKSAAISGCIPSLIADPLHHNSTFLCTANSVMFDKPDELTEFGMQDQGRFSNQVTQDSPLKVNDSNHACCVRNCFLFGM